MFGKIPPRGVRMKHDRVPRRSLLPITNAALGMLYHPIYRGKLARTGAYWAAGHCYRILFSPTGQSQPPSLPRETSAWNLPSYISSSGWLTTQAWRILMFRFSLDCRLAIIEDSLLRMASHLFAHCFVLVSVYLNFTFDRCQHMSGGVRSLSL